MTKSILSEPLQAELSCTARLDALAPHFTKADHGIADRILSHPQTMVRLSARELGRQCGVSEASVVRFAQKLGYNGLEELRQAVRHDLVTSQTAAGQEFPADNEVAEVLAKVVALCSQALEHLVAVLDVDELERAAAALEAADLVHFFAAGGSVRVAQHAAFKLMRMGYLSVVNPEPFAQMAQATLVGPNSVAFGISYTGATKSVNDALAVAGESGAMTVCLTNFAGTEMTEVADVQLITAAPGGVLAANSAQARIAQFAVLDSLVALITPRGGEEGITF
jgi:DNA-binding MurR/RpiR family transcriptional regulator